MILVIGYGNPLRSDDGIGQVIAQSLEGCEDVQVLAVYQLTPELAAPISQAKRVIFVDAREGGVPGTVFQEPLKPDLGQGSFTHHVSPASLLTAARDLYGAAPRGVLVSIVGESFEYGQELTPKMRSVLPEILETLRSLVREMSTEEKRHA